MTRPQWLVATVSAIVLMAFAWTISVVLPLDAIAKELVVARPTPDGAMIIPPEVHGVNTLYVKRIVLVDDNGKRRIVMDVHKNHPSIVFYDENEQAIDNLAMVQAMGYLGSYGGD